MKVNAIQPAHAKRTGKTIGTIGGLGIAGAYVFKNRKDIFVNGINAGIKEVQEQGRFISRNKAVLRAGGVVAAALAASALIGRFVCGTIGKMIDKHNAKKAAKAAQEL